MTRRWLQIILQSDAIFTQSSATVGRAASLDHLPGANLLGAAAQRCYAQLGDAALGAFHLGAVRFGDGRPLHPLHGAAIPTPLSWHELKYGHGFFDLSQTERPHQEQLKQLRGQWILSTSQGWLRWSIDRNTTMRTAIDEGGRAREGLLYGFEAVPAGTSYLVELVANNTDTLERVVQALCQAPIRVGRSRNAEFGEAVVSTVEPPQSSSEPSSSSNPNRLRLLCTSDLALVDAFTGAPRLQPTRDDFGLPGGWSVDLSRSFLRFRSYSPYNGKRRRPDSERQVIVAGSVITFSRDNGAPPADLPALRARVALGVGEHLSSGLGALLVEPAALADARPVVTKAPPTTLTETATAPDDPLVGWLRARQSEISTLDATWNAAEKMAKMAARWDIPRSQWGRIRALAAEARHAGRSSDQVQLTLDEQVNGGVAADVWSKQRGTEIVNWFSGLTAPVDSVRALELLGRRVPRHQANGEEGDHA